MMAKAISIKIDEDIFRKLHIRAAESGKSVQDYVCAMIQQDMFPEQCPQIAPEQAGQLRVILRDISESARQLEVCCEDLLAERGQELNQQTNEVSKAVAPEMTM